MKLKFLVFLFFFISFCFAKTDSAAIEIVDKTSLEIRFRQILDSLVPGSKFGLSVRSVRSGNELMKINGDEKFTPASTLKTLTTAAALFHLPLNYEPKTILFLDGSIQNKIFRGVLRIRGEGDPNLSGRFYSDALYMLETMADSLKNAGIDFIEGQIELDTSFYSGPRKPEHWNPKFYNAWYGAEVTPLSFNDNCTLLRLKPGKNLGDTASISVLPDVHHVEVINNLTTTKKKRRRYTWDLDETKPRITIGGTIGIGLDSVSLVLPVRNPAFYFKAALLKAFENKNLNFKENKKIPRGITIRTFDFSAAPFLSILDEINQRSQNLHAEMLFRNMGQYVFRKGSAEGGKKAVQQFLKEIKINPDAFEIFDGSGLSALNKVKPSAETELLYKMAKSRNATIYINSFASPEIGTGTSRMKLIDTPWKLKFKTGFIGSIHALAGYIFTENDTLAIASYLNETGKTPDAICKDALDSVWVRLFHFATKEYSTLLQAKKLWISGINKKNFQDRLFYFSEHFKETPYLLGGTGEGFFTMPETAPVFRFDSVDCVTFLENVLSLAKAKNENSIFQTLVNVRYLNNEISYQTRKHYFIADWILKGNTAKLIQTKEDTLIQKKIPKLKFFANKGIKGIPDEQITFPYLPKEKALAFSKKTWDANSEIRGIAFVFSGAAVEVFHTGFLILKQGEKPMLRHASQIEKKVVDIPLETYLETSKKKIPGIVQFEFLE